MDAVSVTAAGGDETRRQIHTRATAVESIRHWQAGLAPADSVAVSIGRHADSLGLLAGRHRAALLDELAGTAGLTGDEFEALSLDVAGYPRPDEGLALKELQ